MALLFTIVVLGVLSPSVIGLEDHSESRLPVSLVVNNDAIVRRQDPLTPTPALESTLPPMPDGTGCPENSILLPPVNLVQDPRQPENKMFTCQCNRGLKCKPVSLSAQQAGIKCQFFDIDGDISYSDSQFVCFGKTGETCRADLFMCESPTDKPTPSPSVKPTPSPVAEPTQSCPTNCGGGTCDSSGQCLSCGDPTRMLASGRVDGVYFGKCVLSLKCRARVIQTGSLKGNPCKCLDRQNCFYCSRTVDGDTCLRCQKGYYLHNDECIATCPSDLTSAGISLWGRRCLPPFSCSSGRIVTENYEFGCKCPNPDNRPSACMQCDFEQGEFGQKCHRCKKDKYLNKETHTCEDDCSGLNNVVAYKVGSYGAMCTEPFTCTGKRVVLANGTITSEKCKCPKEVGGNNCNSCAWELDGTTCLD